MTPTQSNMIMVGEKGMDTSGIITRIAEQLLHDKVPEQIGGGRIIELDLQAMMMYQPKEMGSHLNKVFTDIDNHNKSGKPPLFVSLKGFEKAVRPKSIIAAPLEDFFSYWLGETKNVRVIAEVSQYGLDNIKTDAPDLYKLLNMHTLKETNEKQTIARMQDWLYFGRGKALSDKYTIGQAIIESAVTLSNKHVNKEGIVQPGLTVSILELAVTAAEKRGSKEVCLDDVVEAVMTASGKPRDIIETKSNEKLATLNAAVKANLINQDHAIDAITKKTDLMRMGRKRKDKPIGVFMLTGPTGVGKTETAKLIAEHLGAGLTTVDMSNYSDQYTVSQILGSPAGYVGYGETTPLEAVADHDINVVLLDEFEKAHPTIYKAFMSSFDEGRMTLRTNKKLDFSNTIFLLTSNVGEKDKDLVRKSVGFNDETAEDNQAAAKKEAINSILAPEYQGRIDEIIDFNALDKAAIEAIARLKLAKLEKRIADERQHGALKINPKAFNELVEQGFGKGLGARPLERAIENLIDLPLGQWCFDNQDKNPMDYKFTVKNISPEFKLAVTPLKAEPKADATNDNKADVKPKKPAPKAAIK
jgi:ATP-dependent Clp protease ATP-binding subunit ClpA